jgi:hypothetical protein
MKFAVVPASVAPAERSKEQYQVQRSAKTLPELLAAHAPDSKLVSYAHIRARINPAATDADIELMCQAAGVAVFDDKQPLP